MAASSSTLQKQPPKDELPRQRVRELLPNLHLGFYRTGKLNAITDVPGVLVGMLEIDDDGVVEGAGDGKVKTSSAVNTGVTVILPRPNPDWFNTACHASIFSFNGSGELTGSHWIRETGLLNSPIVLTNSFSVGAAYDGIYRYGIREHLRRQGREAELQPGRKGDGGRQKPLVDWFLLPVVGETFDGHLNDIGRMAVGSEHVVQAIDLAANSASNNSPQPVREGSVGGGRGMLTMGFKGGTGTSSRIVPAIVKAKKTEFIVGCLVQSNFGKLEDLHFGSVPVGRAWVKEFAGTEFAGGLIFTGDTADETTQKEGSEGAAKAKPISEAQTPSQGGPTTPPDGSIIVILATNAPLHPTQLHRLAKRATVGLARVGGWGANSSGDIFLAFSTAAPVPRDPEVQEGMSTWEARRTARVAEEMGLLQDTTISGLLEAAGEVVMESVLNAMCMAEGVVGVAGNRAEGVPLGWVREVVGRFGGGV